MINTNDDLLIVEKYIIPIKPSILKIFLLIIIYILLMELIGVNNPRLIKLN